MMKRLLAAIVFAVVFMLTISCTGIFEVTLYFESNGGSQVNPISTDGRSVVAIPDDPLKEGFVFYGWYWDNGTFIRPFTANSLVNEPISENMTVYAKWVSDEIVNTYFTVTFNGTGDSVIPTQSIKYGEMVAVPDNPIRLGYLFQGWYKDVGLTILWDFTTDIIEGNTTIYGKWNAAPADYYIVNFISNSEVSVSSQQVYKGTGLSMPIVSKIGYHLDGWYTSLDGGLTLHEEWSFTSNVVNANFVLYAKWTANQYTISFESNGGSSVVAITQNYGTELTAPVSQKEGYTFIGWFTEIELSNLYVFTTVPAQNLTLYAKWQINQYIISFEENGGSEQLPIIQDYHTLVSRPTDPTKDGYTFVNWYSNSGLTILYSFSTMPAANITLYAKWVINQYTLSFEENGGAVISSITQNYATSIMLPISNKEGYTFVGWFTNSELTNAFELTVMPAENILLYAKWQVNNYEIRYMDFIDEEVQDVYLGAYHSFAITTDNRVYAWGNNDSGQLGGGEFIFDSVVTIPVDITDNFGFDNGESIQMMAAGAHHTIALTTNGRVLIWGSSSQLGLGNTGNIDSPYDITSLFNLAPDEEVVLIQAGACFSIILTSQHRVFSWGDNGYGQLGYEPEYELSSSRIPTEITSKFTIDSDDYIIDISLGEFESFALTHHGILFAWGALVLNADGSTSTSSTPIDITSRVGLTPEDQILEIYSGMEGYVLLWTKDDKIFAWGSGPSIGAGTSTIDKTESFIFLPGEKIAAISIGIYHGIILTNQNRVYIWGGNSDGELGDGTTISKNYLVDITGQFDLYEGEVIRSVCANGHSIAITSYNRIFSWGYNNYGQLGIGHTNLVVMPHLVAITSWEIVATDIFDFNQVLIDDYILSKDFYDFQGWYTSDDLTDSYAFTSMPAMDISLYAKWKSDYVYVLKSDNTYEIIGYNGTDTTLTIPPYYLGKSVTSIGFRAFYLFEGLISVTIPSSITSIGYNAFSGCSNLTSVTFLTGSQLTHIDTDAFQNCVNLTNITIPSSVTSIGGGAFVNCLNLTIITIPSSVVSMGANTFYGCNQLSINSAALTKPSGWDANWNSSNRPVVWGYGE